MSINECCNTIRICFNFDAIINRAKRWNQNELQFSTLSPASKGNIILNTAAAAFATFMIQPTAAPILSMGLAGAYLILLGRSFVSPPHRSSAIKIGLIAAAVIGTFVALVYTPWLMTLSITCGVATAVFLYNLDQTNSRQEMRHTTREPGENEYKSSFEGRCQKRATQEVGKGSEPTDLENEDTHEPGEHPPIDTATDIGNLINAVTEEVPRVFIPWAKEKTEWAKRNVTVAKNEIGDFVHKATDQATRLTGSLHLRALELYNHASQRANQMYQQYQRPIQEHEREGNLVAIAHDEF